MVYTVNNDIQSWTSIYPDLKQLMGICMCEIESGFWCLMMYGDSLSQFGAHLEGLNCKDLRDGIA